MPIDVFVQSSGKLPKHDYTWVHLKRGKQVKVDSPVPPELRTMLDSEALSLILTPLNSQQLLLVVANLETRRGTDSFGRPVRNSIACIGAAADEANLRGIAASALRGERVMSRGQEPLANTVDTEVQFDKKSDVGFRVAPTIQQRLAKLRAEHDDAPQVGQLLEENTEAVRLELALELDHCRLPLDHRGALVIVTRYVEPRQLLRARVWRGFSALVDDSFLAELQQPPKVPRLHLPRFLLKLPKRGPITEENESRRNMPHDRGDSIQDSSTQDSSTQGDPDEGDPDQAD